MGVKIAPKAQAGDPYLKGIMEKSSQEQMAQPPVIKKDVLTKTEPAVIYGAAQLSGKEIDAVDRMLEISQILAPVLPLLKEQEQLKKQLCAVAQDPHRFDPDQPAYLKGAKGVVEFSPEVRRREVKDMNGLLTKLKETVGGYEPLLPLIQIPLKVVDTYLTPDESKLYVGEEEEGSRKLASVRPRKE